MIHIATIHWNTSQWIAPQQAYLRKHLKSDFRVYAWLNNIPDAPKESFYYSCSEPVGPHAIKLNILADIICASAQGPDDIIIFLDGDAFPIADLEPLFTQKLPAHKLLAVQRLENNGDSQPHPCFCATTVGFWQQIRGDWNEGYKWKNQDGQEVTDVGANLYRQLNGLGTPWLPLLRSNKVDLHPVYFGIYGDAIYHHGAGFRRCECRQDRKLLSFSPRQKILSKIIPGYRRMTYRRAMDKLVTENHARSEKIFGQILNDPKFASQFM